MDDKNGIHYLDSSREELDIGAMISDDLKFSTHINKIAAKANNILGIILNTFAYLDLKTFTKLYCTFVRPQLEFAMSAWNPYLIRQPEDNCRFVNLSI